VTIGWLCWISLRGEMLHW